METEPFSVTVTFTPATLERIPALRGWKAGVPGALLRPVLVSLQRNDVVQMQGIPTSEPLFVTARLWTLMEDQVQLQVVLGHHIV